MEFEVTARHILEGRSGEYNSCPVARALWELGYGDVYVDDTVVRVLKGRTVLEAKTPQVLSVFVDDFDNFRPVKPGLFSLDFRLTSDIETKPKHKPKGKKLPQIIGEVPLT